MTRQNNDNDTVMDDATKPVSKLENILALVKKHKDNRERHSDALEASIHQNLSMEEDAALVKALTTADRLYEDVKSLYRNAYPDEPALEPANKSHQSPKEQSQQSTILPVEIPALATEDDKVDTPIGKIHHNAAVQQLHRLGPTVGTSYAAHLHEKRQQLAKGEKETWNMVKQWLTLFNDTPVQRFRNLNAIFRCQWTPLMASDTLSASFRETMEEIGLNKFSPAEIAAAATMMQAKFKEQMLLALTKGQSSVDDIAKVIHNMDMQANQDDKRRSSAVSDMDTPGNPPKSLATKTVRKFSREKEVPPPPPVGGVWCGNGCKQVYFPGHNKVCPKYGQPKDDNGNAPSSSTNNDGKHNGQQRHRNNNNSNNSNTNGHRYHNNSNSSNNDSNAKVNRAANKGKGVQRTPSPAACHQVFNNGPFNKDHEIYGPIDTDKDLWQEYLAELDRYDPPGDKMTCKIQRAQNKQHSDLTDFPFLHTVMNDINVPITIECIQTVALVDGGANFSALDQQFCLTNKIPFDKHIQPVSISLAEDKTKGFIHGRTKAINVYYNGKSYKVEFDVMNLALQRSVSIGTDLMPLLGIAYTGLAVSWTPPTKHEEESPYKDVVVANEDPYGSKEQQETIPPDSFCTHPDAVVYLDTPKDAKGFRVQYKIADTLKPKVADTVRKWLEQKIITPLPSTVDNKWNSPLTLAPKKDSAGNYTDKRPCLDPRHINKYLKEDQFPLPKIEEIFFKLKDAVVYTTLDLTNAFHRFPIHPPHQHKTAFTSVDGLQYMFRGCPFGLKPISSKFQRVMSTLFSQPPFNTYVATFFDDIVVYSSNYQDHRDHTKAVIEELTRVSLTLNPKKCHFAQKTIYLLGFCVAAHGKTYLDPRKVTNTQEWPIPTTGKHIQQFLGLVNYFRTYLPRMAILTAPLDSLRSHEGKLGSKWTEQHTNAFNNIKQALIKAPYLYAPRPEIPFHVATDASDVGLGAVLYQVDSTGKVLLNGFMARSLSKSERNYAVTKKELLAIIFALNKFHQHLWGRRFTLYTDHKALVYLHTQTNLNAMLSKWFDTLLDYDFEIVHLKGMDNILPDALSRLFPTAKDLREQGHNDQTKIDTTIASTDQYQKIMRAINKAKLDEEYLEPPTQEEKDNVLLQAHLFGHFGAEAIVKAVHNNGMHWTNLKQQALDLVKQCTPCQRFNIVKAGYNPHRPVQAKLPGDHWAIDLAGPLPVTKRNNTYLLVMIDICSRFVILRPITDKSAEAVVTAIIPVFCDFGIPTILQSDNGKEFANKVMARFKTKAGFDHRLITPYYPQGNGSAERTVGTSMRLIKKLVEGVTDSWDLFVPSAQLAINAKVSKRLNATPFSVMFGRRINDFKNYKEEEGEKTNLTPVQIEKRIAELQNVIFPAIEEKTAQTIIKQKAIFDKKHIQRDFPMGSYVMEKIHPNFRSKMDARHEGPYQVVRKTQAGTYVLKNTTGDLMPKNYQASQLIAVEDNNADEENTYDVEAIIAHKHNEKTNKYTYKVKWLNYDESHCTWEPSDNFHSTQCIKDYWNRIHQTPQSNDNKRKEKTNTAKQRTKRSRR
ncbi:hypothetical protein [Absidia glauca]|uniref:Reverse transcriptase n=1 Tax=Absidia glauca TaxID=4829 RepID=A0A168NHN4_ABSGL|nr:hypothetical protein [Absidia glauca]